jgi:hypothetical protein
MRASPAFDGVIRWKSERNVLPIDVSLCALRAWCYLQAVGSFCGRRRHVHIRKGASVDKSWLDPEPSLVSSWGLAPKELNSLEQVVRDNLDLFRRKWDERFGS